MADQHIGPYRVLTPDVAVRRFEERQAERADPLTEALDHLCAVVSESEGCRNGPALRQRVSQTPYWRNFAAQTRRAIAEAEEFRRRLDAGEPITPPTFGPGVTKKTYLDTQAPVKRFPLTPKVREFLALQGAVGLFDALYEATADDPQLVVEFEALVDSLKGAAIAEIERRQRAGA